MAVACIVESNVQSRDAVSLLELDDLVARAHTFRIAFNFSLSFNAGARVFERDLYSGDLLGVGLSVRCAANLDL